MIPAKPVIIVDALKSWPGIVRMISFILSNYAFQRYLSGLMFNTFGR